MFALACRRWFSLTAASRRPPDPVLVERRGAVQVISLNRPGSRNAVNKSTAEMLYQAFRQFDSDPSLSVAVLHGVGGCFCAGYDLKELAGEDFSMIRPEDIGGGASPMVSTSPPLNHSPRPSKPIVPHKPNRSYCTYHMGTNFLRLVYFRCFHGPAISSPEIYPVFDRRCFLLSLLIP